MNTPSHSCPVAYHEGHTMLCFITGKPCIYMDDRACEKSREYHIRESLHSQENYQVVKQVGEQIKHGSQPVADVVPSPDTFSLELRVQEHR